MNLKTRNSNLKPTLSLKQMIEAQIFFDQGSKSLEPNEDLLYLSKKWNAFLTIIIVIFGLIGHSITINIYRHTRNRKNSSTVYLLCLAIADSIFLIIHFFEDTVRTYQSIYSDLSFISMINITDKYTIACRLINYIRYVLRFVSAYIIVAFTLKRLLMVYVLTNSNSKSYAWLTVSVIFLIGLFINLWVPFLFEIQTDENKNLYCDIDKKLKTEYFHITVVYICLIMFIPIVTIFLSNSLIIFKAFKANSIQNLNIQQTILVSKNELNTKSFLTFNSSLTDDTNNRARSSSIVAIKSFIEDKSRNVNTVAKILLWISFSYAVLNLPYFVTWSLFFYEVAFQKMTDMVRKDNLFAAVQISELFFILNYSVQFYINYFTSLTFRRQIFLNNYS